jgi:predicted nucleic acid-binding protein
MASAERVFVDTNVLLDVLCKREPFYRDARMVWSLSETGACHGVIAAVSMTNIYYIVRRLSGRVQAEAALRLSERSFQTAPCDADLIESAIALGFDDFEDAVQYASAIREKAKYLVSRNTDHFSGDGVKVVSPAEFLALRS